MADNREAIRRSKEWNTHSILACKLAATGFRGVELNKLNLSLSEVAETPLDNFALPSGIFVFYSLRGSCGLSGA